MQSHNLRHLRLFLAVSETGSITTAAEMFHISQPAVTQAIHKLEYLAGGAILERMRTGLVLTPRGIILRQRVVRAFDLLDPALNNISPRLRLVVSYAQLIALISVCECENFTLSARALGLAQPTVHRAITQFERDAGHQLFQRTSFGLVASKPAQDLAQAARLAFRELEQAEADLDETDGRESGKIVIGALPMARSVLLPATLVAFRNLRPKQPIHVVDGLYDELLTALRRGDIDIIIGALRDPQPIGDIVQNPLFYDRLAVVLRNDHPFISNPPTAEQLAQAQWLVARKGTPSRAQFDTFFANAGLASPQSLVETGSVLLMREMLTQSEFLGCVSHLHITAELNLRLLTKLPLSINDAPRPIGTTTRLGWQPTIAEQLFLDLLAQEAKKIRDVELTGATEGKSA